MFVFAICAAILCAVCNGAAAILQKMGADRQEEVTSLDVGLLWRLAHNLPYVAGVGLDLLGWTLTIFAVRWLPLFLVQSIIASNVMMTALLERFWRGRKLGRRSIGSMLTLLAGLGLIATTATPETSVHVYGKLAAAIIFAPLLLAAAGALCAHFKSRITAPLLAALSGLAFGGTSIVGRVLPLDKPLGALVHDPFVFALAAYGTVGLLLFTLALQRGRATLANAGMAAMQTLVPASVGLAYLGDSVRSNLWPVLIVGALLALAGSTGLALFVEEEQGSDLSPTS